VRQTLATKDRGPLTSPYSPECVEEEFSEVELPLYGIHRSA
jgi:hypothetical protein